MEVEVGLLEFFCPACKAQRQQLLAVVDETSAKLDSDPMYQPNRYEYQTLRLAYLYADLSSSYYIKLRDNITKVFLNQLALEQWEKDYHPGPGRRIAKWSAFIRDRMANDDDREQTFQAWRKAGFPEIERLEITQQREKFRKVWPKGKTHRH